VLCFWGVFFLWNRRGAKNSPRGASVGGELRSRTRGGEAQASTFDNGGGELQGMTHDKVGQNRCGAGCRTPALGWWSSRSVTRGVAMKGANLGFASRFFKTLAQGPSIYRDFGLMISCTCRTPSPSFPIRWGFGFDRILLRFRLGKETPGSVCYLTRGRWRSAHGHISGLKPFLFSKLFSNFQITLNSTQIWILNDSYSLNKIK
jgi:hypothetical protein